MKRIGLIFALPLATGCAANLLSPTDRSERKAEAGGDIDQGERRQTALFAVGDVTINKEVVNALLERTKGLYERNMNFRKETANAFQGLMDRIYKIVAISGAVLAALVFVAFRVLRKMGFRLVSIEKATT